MGAGTEESMPDVERILLERNVPIPLRDGTTTYANV